MLITSRLQWAHHRCVQGSTNCTTNWLVYRSGTLSCVIVCVFACALCTALQNYGVQATSMLPNSRSLSETTINKLHLLKYTRSGSLKARCLPWKPLHCYVQTDVAISCIWILPGSDFRISWILHCIIGITSSHITTFLKTVPTRMHIISQLQWAHS